MGNTRTRQYQCFVAEETMKYAPIILFIPDLTNLDEASIKLFAGPELPIYKWTGSKDRLNHGDLKPGIPVLMVYRGDHLIALPFIWIRY